YQFLVLSDHNVFTDPRRFESLVDTSFILIGGEELTSAWGGRPVHVNGLNIRAVIAARKDSTLVGTIQRNVDAVREVKGTPHINHPNFRWAFGVRELLQIRNDPLLEIWNGHPLVHNEGGDESAGMEEIWDALLSAGRRTYGIAVDDAHHFQGEFAANRSNPGRGWVVIRANRLDPAELMGNLERGLFYASTGVAISRIDVTTDRVALEIIATGDFKYTTSFIGDGGRVLARVGGRTPSFDLTAGGVSDSRLTYVRARVDDSGGHHAWVQPAFIER
ncbi:MAG: hypothetical protein ABI647_06705, partial [Gemmatimonadota bacterium]